MNLRDYLDGREKELIGLIAARKQRMIPYEAELAEIRRAKSALTPAGPGPEPQMNELRRYLTDRERELRETVDEIAGDLADVSNELAEVQKVKASIGVIPTKQRGFGDAFGQPFAEWEFVPEAVRIPYQSLTIKELVQKALKEHFPTGATIAQLGDFFREKWGRGIDRPSLSPQLSRLYRQGLIGRIRSTRGWFLYEKEGKIEGFRPYLHREHIVWCEPLSTDLGYEPLLATDIEAEVAKDRMPYKRTIATIRSGVTSRQVRLVWLLPHEVTGDDDTASWNEALPPDNEEAQRGPSGAHLSVDG
jgi:hypothetical protein